MRYPVIIFHIQTAIGSRREGGGFICLSLCFFTYRAFAGCVAFKHSAVLVSSFSAFPQQCSRRWCPETFHFCLLLTTIYLLSYFSNQPLGNKWENQETGFLEWREKWFLTPVTSAIGFLWELTKLPLGFFKCPFQFNYVCRFLPPLWP